MLQFLAAAIAEMFEKPTQQPRPSRFDSVESFLSFLRENGGQIDGDGISENECIIAEQAKRDGLVKYTESVWGSSDWYYLP